ncbi:MAG: hypothetical protein ACKOEV_10615 [Cytophagales bacterium]
MALFEKLKLLVNLARIDGNMAERERNYILNIGKANGFPESSVGTLFYSTHEVIMPESISAEEKFDYIFSLVQLMRLDERLYQEELKFCFKIAERLGYSQEAIFELLMHVKNVTDQESQRVLRGLVDKYLKK